MKLYNIIALLLTNSCSRRGGSSVFEPWVSSRSFNFQLPIGGGSFCFLTGIDTQLTKSKTEVSQFICKWRKRFRKYTWLVYSRDDNFMHCQICTKAKRSNGLSKESQGRNFQNAALCGHAGLKEHKLPTCVYLLFVLKLTRVHKSGTLQFTGCLTPKTY